MFSASAHLRRGYRNLVGREDARFQTRPLWPPLCSFLPPRRLSSPLDVLSEALGVASFTSPLLVEPHQRFSKPAAERARPARMRTAGRDDPVRSCPVANPQRSLLYDHADLTHAYACPV